MSGEKSRICGACGPVHGDPSSMAEESLFDRIGGEPRSRASGRRFLRAGTCGSELAPFFDCVSMSKLHAMQKEFFSEALGGPLFYTGRPLREVHGGRGIRKSHLRRFYRPFAGNPGGRTGELLTDASGHPMADSELVGHAECCDRCKSQLGLWHQINDAFAVIRDDSRGARARPSRTQDLHSIRTRKIVSRLSGVMAAGAAAVLFFTGVLPTSLLPSSTDNRYALTDSPVASTPPSRPPLRLAAPSVPPPDPSQSTADASVSLTEMIPENVLSDPWWQAVRSEGWVSQTIPAVDSVRIGVAPIGRSMKQAIAILMSHPENAPASTSTLPASESDVSFPKEQTTSRRSGPASLLAIS